ncbi:ImuA family protein [Corallococcus exercitus]|uniref:ImuA family protein n=1 Tax=Corallococcus exercitus TaxID=2316736 RepID=UPI001FD3DED9|nr:recombinase RecA [Corallococcus exercitus]
MQAAPRRTLSVLRTGVDAVDALLPQGGLPLGASVELCGEAASGRTSLALRAVASAHRELRLCAWVDGPKELYPPAAAALGVDLERLLVVRPRAFAQRVWSTVQLARSGAFTAVVLDLTHGVGAPGRPERLALTEARKLVDAAARGGTLVLLLTSPEAPADGLARLRLEARGVQGWSVELERSRGGGVGTRVVRRAPLAGALPGGGAGFRGAAAGRGRSASRGRGAGLLPRPGRPRAQRPGHPGAAS